MWINIVHSKILAVTGRRERILYLVDGILKLQIILHFSISTILKAHNNKYVFFQLFCGYCFSVPTRLCWFQIWRNISKKTTPEETRETKAKEAFFQILGIFLETLLLWFIVFGTCLFNSVWPEINIKFWISDTVPVGTYFENKNPHSLRRDFSIYFLHENTKSIRIRILPCMKKASTSES